MLDDAAQPARSLQRLCNRIAARAEAVALAAVLRGDPRGGQQSFAQARMAGANRSPQGIGVSRCESIAHRT